MTRKKILMIAYTNYETDARVIKEAETAYSGGYEVDFISLRRKHEKARDVINGINIYRVRQNRYRGSQNSMYLVTYVEFFFRVFIKTVVMYFQNRYVVIHINNIPDFMVFTAILPKLFGAKIILDIHDPMPDTFLTKFKGNHTKLMYKLLLFQEQFSAKFANAVITVHEPVKNDVLVKDGISENKITVLPNFADKHLFKLVDNYHVNTPIKMIFHGTIARRFGLDKVILALSKIKNSKDIYLKILGEGDYAEELKKLIESFRPHTNIDFENTVYPVSDLPEILSEFHIGLVSYELSPATDYMLPVKMLELLAMGIPVITVRNTAIDYYFENGHCLFYDPDNIQSLINLFEKIIEDHQLIIDVRNNWLKLRDKYSWQNAGKVYNDLLDSLITKGNNEQN